MARFLPDEEYSSLLRELHIYKSQVESLKKGIYVDKEKSELVLLINKRK